MWSFVESEDNKQQIWHAIDKDSGLIVGVYVGSRDKEGAKGLWDSLPGVYRQCAVCFTDFGQHMKQYCPRKDIKPSEKIVEKRG